MRASPLGMRLFAAPKVAGGLGPEIVTDGAFSSGANWTQGSGWTVSGNQGVGVSAAGFLWQSNAGIVAGHTYQVTYTISGYSSGFMFVYLGGTVTLGTQRSANGTYTENITPTGGGELGFEPSGTPTLNVSAFSVKEVL